MCALPCFVIPIWTKGGRLPRHDWFVDHSPEVWQHGGEQQCGRRGRTLVTLTRNYSPQLSRHQSQVSCCLAPWALGPRAPRALHNTSTAPLAPMENCQAPPCRLEIATCPCGAWPAGEPARRAPFAHNMLIWRNRSTQVACAVACGGRRLVRGE